MALNKFVKGQTDYTEKMNENFEGLADGTLLPEGTAIAKDGLTQMKSLSIEQVSDDIVNFDEFYSKGLAFGSSEKPTAKEKMLDVSSLVSKERGDIFIKAHRKGDFDNRIAYIMRPSPWMGIYKQQYQNGVPVRTYALHDEHNLPVESGNWTPSFSGETVAGNYTYVLQNGKYYRFGDLVFISAFIQLSQIIVAGSGRLKINNIPFPCTQSGASGAAMGGVSTTYTSGIQNGEGVQFHVSANVLLAGNIKGGTFDASSLTANTQIGFSGCYRIS